MGDTSAKENMLSIKAFPHKQGHLKTSPGSAMESECFSVSFSNLECTSQLYANPPQTVTEVDRQMGSDS